LEVSVVEGGVLEYEMYMHGIADGGIEWRTDVHPVPTHLLHN
jgi:hypothetical protein